MRAHELLDSPEKWIQGNFAKNWLGDACSPDSEDAAQFSLFGAISCTSAGPKQVLEKITAITPFIEGHSVSSWNDCPERTYEDVVNLLTVLGL